MHYDVPPRHVIPKSTNDVIQYTHCTLCITWRGGGFHDDNYEKSERRWKALIAHNDAFPKCNKRGIANHHITPLLTAGGSPCLGALANPSQPCKNVFTPENRNALQNQGLWLQWRKTPWVQSHTAKNRTPSMNMHKSIEYVWELQETTMCKRATARLSVVLVFASPGILFFCSSTKNVSNQQAWTPLGHNLVVVCSHSGWMEVST